MHFGEGGMNTWLRNLKQVVVVLAHFWWAKVNGANGEEKAEQMIN